MVTAKVWQLARRPDGEPTKEDFKLVEEELPELADGEILVAADFLTVDPYMRLLARTYPLGECFVGGQVGTVTASKAASFPVGTKVYNCTGWRTHSIINPSKEDVPVTFTSLSFMESLSSSLALGILGMPGITAYFGLQKVCEPKKEEVLVVSGAAGAVGSAVGQIGKINGCTVIGFTSSAKKVEWLKTIGFDFAFNYKTEDVSECLKKAAPKGIDCYFDNVGGGMSAKVLAQMNDFGRVSACGAISMYNDKELDVDGLFGYSPYALIFKQIKVEGFYITKSKWTNQWMEGLKQLTQWVKEGKIKAEETVTEGFENMPDAFIGLFRGSNTGKAVVKV